MSSTTTASLPYREPGIVNILIVSSFLLVLNAVNYILDKLVYCGLEGQLFIGIAWGAPGANWLSPALQQSVVELGYLGLILIVYEGGLASDLKALRANLALSLLVALTGIATPVALSFALLGLMPLSPVQAFAAGAALCSTSLGTIFTVLSTSGLTESRLGVVLTSAAMLDDIVGLIMVQIISSLGAGSSFMEGVILRPVFVSVAFAVCTPLVCMFVARPLIRIICCLLDSTPNANFKRIFRSSKAALVYQTLLLLAMVTGATYAGTSNLFAAYLTGVSVTWLGECISTQAPEMNTRQAPRQPPSQNRRLGTTPPGRNETFNRTTTTTSSNTQETLPQNSGRQVFEKYYSPLVNAILRPFFFASIGFAIPITKMFTGRIVWRGLVYTLLMIFGKLICGLWLIRFASVSRGKRVSRVFYAIELSSWKIFGSKIATTEANTARLNQRSAHMDTTSDGHQRPSSSKRQKQNNPTDSPTPSTHETSKPTPPQTTQNPPNTSRKRTPPPKSLYPATILGSAMISRGEIGFLISSIAESQGVFGQQNSNEVFLVVTWAILLCTLIGPVAVGLLVKRVKRLQRRERRKDSGCEDPLGVWGVVSVEVGR
ncbi:Hypothetical protein R9X50_00195600 [Acrodontium crateriforme]|uniref:Cation/H+ exchanger transmembrane domain-containing protein n=1 Tax=Acrodontium crateriforme TaxID=150365 RepID=A0AAQ3R881_9PEZI|nr:Hypothetical protein R9X50_00195600 [Acrodontium crateriforme]